LASLHRAEEARRKQLADLAEERRLATLNKPLTVHHAFQASTLRPRTREAWIPEIAGPAGGIFQARSSICSQDPAASTSAPTTESVHLDGKAANLGVSAGKSSRVFQETNSSGFHDRASKVLELLQLADAAQEHRVRSHHIAPAPPVRGDSDDRQAELESDRTVSSTQLLPADAQGISEQELAKRQWRVSNRHLMRMALFSPEDSHPDLQLLCGGHAVVKLKPGQFRSARAALSVPRYRTEDKSLSYFEVQFQFAPDGVARYSKGQVRRFLRALDAKGSSSCNDLAS